LEEHWKELESGGYNWTHLAYSIWPDRVRQKCKTDRSIAIVHGLEELCELADVQSTPTKRRHNAGRIARSQQMNLQGTAAESSDE